MGSEIKFERYVAIEELPGFFRDLADAMEKGGSGEFINVDDFRKLKITLKNEYGRVFLKTKCKPARQGDSPVLDGVNLTDVSGDVGGASGKAADAPGVYKPRYKDLKKRMKGSFKMIFKMVHDGLVPPELAVESFLADSDLMVSYPGYGDEYYEEYTRACEDFEKAYTAGDLDGMTEFVDILANLKGRCHAKYD